MKLEHLIIKMFVAIFLPFLVPRVCRYEYVEKLRAKYVTASNSSPLKQWAAAASRYKKTTTPQKRSSDTQLLLPDLSINKNSTLKSISSDARCDEVGEALINPHMVRYASLSFRFDLSNYVYFQSNIPSNTLQLSTDECTSMYVRKLTLGIRDYVLYILVDNLLNGNKLDETLTTFVCYLLLNQYYVIKSNKQSEETVRSVKYF